MDTKGDRSPSLNGYCTHFLAQSHQWTGIRVRLRACQWAKKETLNFDSNADANATYEHGYTIRFAIFHIEKHLLWKVYTRPNHLCFILIYFLSSMQLYYRTVVTSMKQSESTSKLNMDKHQNADTSFGSRLWYELAHNYHYVSTQTYHVTLLLDNLHSVIPIWDMQNHANRSFWITCIKKSEPLPSWLENLQVQIPDLI